MDGWKDCFEKVVFGWLNGNSTKDLDFFNRSVLWGHPPKVIQLSLGNCPTSRILEVLSRDKDAIEEFAKDQTESLFVIE